MSAKRLAKGTPFLGKGEVECSIHFGSTRISNA